MSNATGKPLTYDELVIACKNIGFDLNCGACASLFFTGSAPYRHDQDCTTRSEMRPQDPHCGICGAEGHQAGDHVGEDYG